MQKKNPLKIKVSREALIRAIEKRAEKSRGEFAEATRKYAPAAKTYQRAVVVALEKYLSAAKRGILPKATYRKEVTVNVGVELPPKPALRATEYERVLRVLKLSAEPSIEICADDYAQYLD